jgi:hypothetical protein
MVQKDNTITIVKYIGIALVVFIAFLFGKKIWNFFGMSQEIKESSENRQTTDINEDALQETYKQVNTAQSLTWSKAQLKGFADIIFTSLDSIIEDEESAGLYLAMPRNDADFWELEKQFGVRESTVIGMTVFRGRLQAFIQSQLSNSKRLAINDNYRRKGIKARI